MLITCDGCNTKIRVPDSAAGKRVKCPKCATLIRVPELEPTSESANPESAGVSSTPLPPAPKPTPEPAQEKAAEDTDGTGVTSTPSSSRSKPPPIKKSNSAAWDEDDDLDDDDDDRKKKRSKRDDDNDDDDDKGFGGQMRRRPSAPARSGHLKTHRAGMIVAFGIIGLISFFIFPIIAIMFGPMAWFMGNSDLEEMRAGTMDPDGESQTQMGRTLGMIATLLFFVGALVGVALFGVMFLGCCGLPCCGAAIQPPRR